MPEHILRKGAFWDFASKIIPGLDHCATTLFSVIFMPKWYFVNPEGFRETALLLHEKEHVAQWKKYGLGFTFSYLFNKEKRKEYELTAYRVQIKYLMEHGVYIDKEGWAKTISSLYSVLNFITYDEAYTFLDLLEKIRT